MPKGAFYKDLKHARPDAIPKERIYALPKEYVKLNNGIPVFCRDPIWPRLGLHDTTTLHEIRGEFGVKVYLEIEVEKAIKVSDNERRAWAEKMLTKVKKGC